MVHQKTKSIGHYCAPMSEDAQGKESLAQSANKKKIYEGCVARWEKDEDHKKTNDPNHVNYVSRHSRQG